MGKKRSHVADDARQAKGEIVAAMEALFFAVMRVPNLLERKGLLEPGEFVAALERDSIALPPAARAQILVWIDALRRGQEAARQAEQAPGSGRPN
jgi:hypothetical protein